MHAEVLRRFFEGSADAAELARDLPGSWIPTGGGSQSFKWTDLDKDFEVEPHHLVRVCDAVLSGDLPADLVQVVGSCLVASSHWHWPEGELADRILEVVNWWDTPEINYELSPAMMLKCRHWILTGEKTFTPDDYYRRPSAGPA